MSLNTSNTPVKYDTRTEIKNSVINYVYKRYSLRTQISDRKCIYGSHLISKKVD